MTANLVGIFNGLWPLFWLGFLSFFFIAIKLIIYGMQVSLKSRQSDLTQATPPGPKTYGVGLLSCIVIAVSMLLKFMLIPTFLLQDINSLLAEKDVNVTVNGETTIDRNEVRIAFNEFITSKKGGSHPTDSVHLEIDGTQLGVSLILKRDSRDSELYWVYIKNGESVGELGYIFLSL